jgi:hypothetical protein
MGMPRKLDPTKSCDHCGVKLQRRMIGLRLEDRSVFLRRKYCSLTCANSKRRPLTKHGYSWRARKHLKPTCEGCGHPKSLEAHHVDQDKSNNVPTNIQTLCTHCHDFWHATAKRLGRDIAGRMPPLT